METIKVMNDNAHRDYIIIGNNGKPLEFASDSQIVVYGGLEDAQADFNPSFDKSIVQQSLAVVGRIERGNYDYYTKTNVKFTPHKIVQDEIPYGEIVYLPSEIANDMGIYTAMEGAISIRLLQEPTEAHNEPQDMDSKPRLTGWVSRAKRHAYHERSTLCFSTNKPTPTDNGYFEDKQHSFCINPKEFSHIEEMSEPIPAVLEVFRI